jgi:late competence protein required for DNA uptake (superfamily II DNA/RNA helicase)
LGLQNLSRILDKYEQQFGSSANEEQFEVLKGLPFYNWSTVTNDSQNADSAFYQQPTTTFNHAIGLPRKEDRPMPLFDYEQLLYNTLQSNKHVWIKKATGLGVTEFMLRYMAWLCFQNEKQKFVSSGSQMCIVTGPRIELAITLIDRMKGLFRQDAGKISFDTKETVIELNGVHIEAYPSHHLDAMRGLVNVSFIYIDEADFMPPGQQQDARDVSERYIGKSDPHIVMVSTPNAPEGLFERIEQEPEETCLYKRLFLDYTYGLGRIYNMAEIDAAKASPSFEREYNLKYLGLIGNVFHTKGYRGRNGERQEIIK